MEKHLTLWSIQTLEAWNQLNQKGFLLGSKKFIDQDYFEAYEWMKSRMIEKLGLPKTDSQYPLWAWYQHQDKNNRKPDLRRSGHLPKNTPGVRIEFSKSNTEVLLSDFELWHQPLFYKGYIGLNETKSIEFEDHLIDLGLKNMEFSDYPNNIKKAIINSWENLFNLNFNDKYFTTDMDNKMIQACFWQLNKSEITKVDHFIAK